MGGSEEACGIDSPEERRMGQSPREQFSVGWWPLTAITKGKKRCTPPLPAVRLLLPPPLALAPPPAMPTTPLLRRPVGPSSEQERGTVGRRQAVGRRLLFGPPAGSWSAARRPWQIHLGQGVLVSTFFPVK